MKVSQGVGYPSLESHHVIRIGNRKRLQCDGVVGGEESRVDANTQRQGKHGNQRESRIPRKGAQRMTKILSRLLDPQKGSLLPVQFLGLLYTAVGAAGREPGVL